MHISRISEGKIVERWGQEDNLGLMQQLGAIPRQGRARVSLCVPNLVEETV